MSRDEIDYYRVLGVPPHASAAEIRRAYLEKAKTHHPDVTGSEEQPGEIRRINDAFRVLSDRARRREYDRRRADRREQVHRRVRPRRSEATLPITPEESRYGGRIRATLRVPVDCECSGERSCPRCSGRQWFEVQIPLALSLPPGCSTGTRLRVPLNLGSRGRVQVVVLTVRVDPNCHR